MLFWKLLNTPNLVQVDNGSILEGTVLAIDTVDKVIHLHFQLLLVVCDGGDLNQDDLFGFRYWPRIHTNSAVPCHAIQGTT